MTAHSIFDLDVGTIVVVPSLSFPAEELRKISGIQFYEERMLFVLLMLDRPDIQVVFVTSSPIDPTIVDYYLGFLDDPMTARTRLHLVALDDDEEMPLSHKLLRRRDALDYVRALLRDGREPWLLPFNVTEAESRLARELDVPTYGSSPAVSWLGGKSGSRTVAKDVGIPVIDGTENLTSIEAVEGAVAKLKREGSLGRAVVIKLNEGFSGQGNAIIELDRVASPLRLSPTMFCAAEEAWPSFARKIAAQGAVVEELIRGPGMTSPSVQMNVSPGGVTEIVSTHDQILGGPEGQVYLGCRFPARAEYRELIQERAAQIGEALASKGAVGFFAIDFIVVPRGTLGTSKDFLVYLSEINLRVGGTTHPFQMARLATRGRYDVASGHLVAQGRSKFYVASDNLQSAGYVGLHPATVIGALQAAELAFDRARGVGTTLHLLGALHDYGKLGVVSIANSAEEAQSLFERTSAALDEIHP